MNVTQEQLDAWAASMLAVNGALLALQKALNQGNVQQAQQWAAKAQHLNWITEKALVASGAADPVDARLDTLSRDLPEREQAALLPPGEMAFGPVGLRGLE